MIALGRDLNEEGYIAPLSLPARIKLQAEIQSLQGKNNKSATSSQWSFAGPEVHMRARYSEADSVFPLSKQTNTHYIDQRISNPDVLFCGTESGGVYKSVDEGAN